MKQSLAVVTVAVLIGLSATGCSSATGQAAPTDLPKKDAESDSTLTSITKAVLTDAASQTGIESAAVTVESAEAVVWADGSLGCPAPGMSYTMAQVPGYRIRVHAGTRELDYHANRRGYFILCPSERATDPVGPVAY